MYSRQVEDRTLTFGVSGMLLMNALVMYDHQTESLWSQVTGGAISGDLIGTSLGLLPAQLTTWSAWATEHPDTLVLQKGDDQKYSFDPYDRYYLDNSAGLFGPFNRNDRLPSKALVVGVTADGVAKAYPFAELTRTPVVNDTLGQRPIVVAFDQETKTGAVFSRRVGERVLTFEASETQDDLLLKDQETGSEWSPLSGRAVQGPLTGETLEQQPSMSLFWFAWADFHPETEIYGLK